MDKIDQTNDPVKKPIRHNLYERIKTPVWVIDMFILVLTAVILGAVMIGLFWK